MFGTEHRNRTSNERTIPAAAPAASYGHSRNLAARMGRWSAAHWKTATFGWLAFVVVAFALGGLVGTKNIDPNTAGAGRVRPRGQDPRLPASSSPPARAS